jgi:hypothetical protein
VFGLPVDLMCRPVPEDSFWEAASKMGNSWFGLTFRLLSVKPFNTSQLRHIQHTLPRALVFPLIPIQVSHSFKELPVDNLTLGSMVGLSTFLQLSNSAGLDFLDCVLHLNVLWRQLELHFEVVLPEVKPEKYKIILPLKFITADSFTVNRFQSGATHHSIFLESSVAPQMWRKSETIGEDLKDRLFWSENEQWIRQCDLVRNASDPSVALMDTRITMKNIVLPIGNPLRRSKEMLILNRALESILPSFLCTYCEL